MPDVRVAGMAVSLTDYIYVVGGSSDRFYKQPFSSLLRYDPVVDEWKEMTPLLEDRDHVAAVAYDGKIYAFGGRLNKDYNSMEIYDPATDTWTPGPNMRFPRAGHGAVVIGNLVFIVGGEQIGVFPEQIVNSVEVYNPHFNQWVKVFDMPLGLHGIPTASVDGVLFILGGSSKAGGVINNGQVWGWKLPEEFP